MPKSTPLSDDDLRALTDSEMRNSVGYASGKLANMRQKAQWYYLAEAKGDLAPPEIEGRSSVIVPVVRNTIESMLPQLAVKFWGSDEVVQFEPTKPGDEKAAEQATDYINHLFYRKNDGERVAYNAIKDALLSKKGFVKVWWDNSDEVTKEEYRGISDVELSQVMDDEEIEIVEQKSYPDEEDAEQRKQAIERLTQQLQQALQNPIAAQNIQAQIQNISSIPAKLCYDITCERTKKGGRIQVVNVPPEEFLICRDAKTISEARFVAHRVPRTLSDLRTMGYKNIDDIAGDDQAVGLNMERVERLSWDDELAYAGMDHSSTSDQSQRIVWVSECYIRCDADGDGISELRKIVRAGNQILENEVVDCAPFVDFDCLPMPHKFFGLSIADLAMEGQRMETSLVRATLDNTYLQSNGRYFAVENQVNLDDLLFSRPGGVVRIKQQGAVGRLDQGVGDLQSTQQMIEYVKGFNEDSTGWSRYNQGSDGDSLNQTATGVNIVTNRADMRLDLIARNLARGFSDLFKMMLKLVSQFTQKEDIVRLRGEWVPIDPREWVNGFSVTINVGLGTGNSDQQVKKLMAMLNEQKQALAIGIATPENIYQSEMELSKVLGFRNGDRFWTDPAKNPQPQHPNPEMMKIQAQSQAEQQKMQMLDQQHQRELQQQAQLEQMKQQAQAAQVQHQNELEAQRELQKQQLEAQVAQHKANLDAQQHERDMEFEKWKAELQAQTQIYLAQITAGNAAPTDLKQDPDMTNALALAIDGFRASIDKLGAPRQIIRGPDGRAQGIM